MEAAEFAKG